MFQTPPVDPFKAALDRTLLKHYLELDQWGRRINAPKTDDELDQFIQIAYGVKLARKVCTVGHRSPFQLVADLFFERVDNALGFANRAGGKTFAIALLNHLDMVFKDNCEIASAGAVLDQANKCYRYFQSFLQLPWFVDLSQNYGRVTGIPLCNPKEAIQSHTQFGNGSRLQILTASEKGFRGEHPQKLRLDEIDEIEWSLLQTSLFMATARHGIKAQNVFTSTRQYAAGTMARLLDEATERGIQVYEWNVWESLERCTRRCERDAVHGDCPVQVFCKGRAHHSAGHITIQDYVRNVRMIDRERFETEWLNIKPSKNILVYSMFDPQRHVLNEEKLRDLCGSSYPERHWAIVSGLDFGHSPGHPFVYAKFAQIPNNGAWVMFHEYAAEQRLIRDHAKAIRNSPFYDRSEDIYADWDAQDRMELKSYGIKTRQAVKGPDSVRMGIDYVCSLLRGFPPREEPMLYIWHTCKLTLHEWNRYSWKIGHDGTPDRTGNPNKINDNTSDATRMALCSYRKHANTQYRARMLPHI